MLAAPTWPHAEGGSGSLDDFAKPDLLFGGDETRESDLEGPPVGRTNPNACLALVPHSREPNTLLKPNVLARTQAAIHPRRMKRPGFSEDPLSVPPGVLDLDTIGAAVRAELADGTLRRVAIYSLGELVFASRESERFPAFARALTGSIRAGGASSLITSEITTLGPTIEPLAHLSFLFHNLILLRYIEIESEIRRAISILKMRDSDHSEAVWEFAIGKQGLEVGDKLEGLTGILGWTALRDDTPR